MNLQTTKNATIFERIYVFGFNFLNTSIGTSSPNSSICNGNMTILRDNLNLLNLQMTNSIFDEASVSINRLLKAINPASLSCYYSIFEFVQIGQDYFFTIQDLNKIAYNIIHNLGNIYDNGVEFIDIVKNPLLADINWWKK